MYVTAWRPTDQSFKFSTCVFGCSNFGLANSLKLQERGCPARGRPIEKVGALNQLERRNDESALARVSESTIHIMSSSGPHMFDGFNTNLNYASLIP